MFNILLAEDDENLRKLIKKHLIMNNYKVYDCKNGEEALNLCEKNQIDLVLSDIMMPIIDGNELIRRIKLNQKEMPIIMLTALDTIEEKRKSFIIGADDYVTKPIDYDELMLRIEALLRRYKAVNGKNISYKTIKLDYDKKILEVGGNIIELTKKEFMLIYKMISTPERIFSRLQLLDEIWGYDSYSSERTVDVHLSKLREKINSTEIEIVGVRGLGYKVILK